MTALLILLIAGTLTGCAAQRPALYPNAKLRSAGDARARADIDDCIALARASGVDDGRAGRIAKETATNAAVGAGTGAVVGAIGDRSAGQGAAIGAAGTATATLLRGMFRSSEPESIHKRFVETCLADRGYQLIGWQ